MIKFTKTDSETAVKFLCSVSHNKYKSDSFAAGFLGSILSDVFPVLPKEKQEEVLRNIMKTAYEMSEFTA